MKVGVAVLGFQSLRALRGWGGGGGGGGEVRIGRNCNHNVLVLARKTLCSLEDGIEASRTQSTSFTTTIMILTLNEPWQL